MAESEKEADFFEGATFQEETGEATEAAEFFDGFEEREPTEQGKES